MADKPKGRNCEDITELTGLPKYRHYRCKDCGHTFYSKD